MFAFSRPICVPRSTLMQFLMLSPDGNKVQNSIGNPLNSGIQCLFVFYLKWEYINIAHVQ